MLGKFLYVDDQMLKGSDKIMVVYLIELDINKGIISEIELERWHHSFIQHVDYWHLPFRCRNCRNVGHLLISCPRGPINHFHQKKSPLFGPVSEPEEASSHFVIDLLPNLNEKVEHDKIQTRSSFSSPSNESWSSYFNSFTMKDFSQ